MSNIDSDTQREVLREVGYVLGEGELDLLNSGRLILLLYFYFRRDCEM